MTLKDLKRNLELFKQSITFLKQKKLTPSKKDSKNFTDFQKQQESYHQKSYFNALNSIHEEIENLDKYDEHTILIEKEAQKLTNDNLEKNVQIIANIFDILKEIPEEEQKPRSVKSNTLLFKLPTNVPVEVQAEIQADLLELERCYKSSCHRSAVILCGRLLETALHRKYFDVTNNDILETNPGIGLGTLIAKLSEKGMKFDPGVTQQIHLINQVRIFSVHKKQDTFCPSPNQSQAMILFTLDTLEKLFAQ